MVREAGASEVHVRISSPPTAYPCYYGIDTPTRKELIATSHSIEEINKYITSDSIGYISIPGMLKASGYESACCDACLTGNYPIDFTSEGQDDQIPLFETEQRKD